MVTCIDHPILKLNIMRFEDFIDIVLNEEKEFILLGDFNKNMLNNDTDREWGNFTTSLFLKLS